MNEIYREYRESDYSQCEELVNVVNEKTSQKISRNVFDDFNYLGIIKSSQIMMLATVLLNFWSLLPNCFLCGYLDMCMHLFGSNYGCL